MLISAFIISLFVVSTIRPVGGFLLIISLFTIRFISPISKCVHNIPLGNLNCHINVILCKLIFIFPRKEVEGEKKE